MWTGRPSCVSGRLPIKFAFAILQRASVSAVLEERVIWASSHSGGWQRRQIGTGNVRFLQKPPGSRWTDSFLRIAEWGSRFPTSAEAGITATKHWSELKLCYRRLCSVCQAGRRLSRRSGISTRHRFLGTRSRARCCRHRPRIFSRTGTSSAGRMRSISSSVARWCSSTSRSLHAVRVSWLR